MDSEDTSGAAASWLSILSRRLKSRQDSEHEQAQIRIMLSESLRAVVSQRLLRRADGQGRVPAYELLIVTQAVGNMIRDDKTYQLGSVMQTGKAQGMMTLDDSLQQLLAAGTIDRAEARRYAANKDRFS